MPLNPFDWALIAAAGFFVIKGIVKGAVHEVFSLAALLLASVAALCYYPLVLAYIQPYIAAKWGQLAMACLCIFLIVWIAVNLAGWLIEKFLKLIWLGFLDHAGGLLIGGAKAYVLACAVVVGLLLVPLGQEVLKDSRLAPYTTPLIVRVAPYLPDGLRKMLAEKLGLIPPADWSFLHTK